MHLIRLIHTGVTLKGGKTLALSETPCWSPAKHPMALYGHTCLWNGVSSPASGAATTSPRRRGS